MRQVFQQLIASSIVESVTSWICNFCNLSRKIKYYFLKNKIQFEIMAFPFFYNQWSLKLKIEKPYDLRSTELIYLLSIQKRHKYASSGKSLIEPLFVPWWNFAITLCPLWIAPNMITFLGFLVNLQAFLIGLGFVNSSFNGNNDNNY